MKGCEVCKECGEQTLRKKDDGLWECLSCGRMTNKQPVKLAPKIAGDWRKGPSK